MHAVDTEERLRMEINLLIDTIILLVDIVLYAMLCYICYCLFYLFVLCLRYHIRSFE